MANYFLPLFGGGEGEDPELWLSSMEKFFDNFQISMDRYVEISVPYLRGYAADWARANRSMISENWCAFSYNLLWKFDPSWKVPEQDDMDGNDNNTRDTTVCDSEEPSSGCSKELQVVSNGYSGDKEADALYTSDLSLSLITPSAYNPQFESLDKADTFSTGETSLVLVVGEVLLESRGAGLPDEFVHNTINDQGNHLGFYSCNHQLFDKMLARVVYDYLKDLIIRMDYLCWLFEHTYTMAYPGNNRVGTKSIPGIESRIRNCLIAIWDGNGSNISVVKKTKIFYCKVIPPTIVKQGRDTSLFRLCYAVGCSSSLFSASGWWSESVILARGHYYESECLPKFIILVDKLLDVTHPYKVDMLAVENIFDWSSMWIISTTYKVQCHDSSIVLQSLFPLKKYWDYVSGCKYGHLDFTEWPYWVSTMAFIPWSWGCYTAYDNWVIATYSCFPSTVFPDVHTPNATIQGLYKRLNATGQSSPKVVDTVNYQCGWYCKHACCTCVQFFWRNHKLVDDSADVCSDSREKACPKYTWSQFIQHAFYRGSKVQAANIYVKKRDTIHESRYSVSIIKVYRVTVASRYLQVLDMEGGSCISAPASGPVVSKHLQGKLGDQLRLNCTEPSKVISLMAPILDRPRNKQFFANTYAELHKLITTSFHTRPFELGKEVFQLTVSTGADASVLGQSKLQGIMHLSSSLRHSIFSSDVDGIQSSMDHIRLLMIFKGGTHTSTNWSHMLNKNSSSTSSAVVKIEHLGAKPIFPSPFIVPDSISWYTPFNTTITSVKLILRVVVQSQFMAGYYHRHSLLFLQRSVMSLSRYVDSVVAAIGYSRHECCHFYSLSTSISTHIYHGTLWIPLVLQYSTLEVVKFLVWDEIGVSAASSSLYTCISEYKHVQFSFKRRHLPLLQLQNDVDLIPAILEVDLAATYYGFSSAFEKGRVLIVGHNILLTFNEPTVAALIYSHDKKAASVCEHTILVSAAYIRSRYPCNSALGSACIFTAQLRWCISLVKDTSILQGKDRSSNYTVKGETLKRTQWLMKFRLDYLVFTQIVKISGHSSRQMVLLVRIMFISFILEDKDVKKGRALS